MKINDKSAYRNRRGLNFIELIVTTVILAIVLHVIFNTWMRLSRISGNIGDTSAYYQTMGYFLSRFNMDARTAIKIKKLENEVILTVPADEAMLAVCEISYVLNEKTGTIIRKAGDSTESFQFGTPPKKGEKLIFKIE